jgi:hypothetical protein
VPQETVPAFRDASFVVTFASLAAGKSVDHISAFPRAMVCALTREIKSATSVLGYHPPIITQVQTLYDVDARVNELLTARMQRNTVALLIDSVIADDFTVMCYQTEQALREGVRVNGSIKKPKGWDLWTEQRIEALSIAFQIAEKLKQAGLHFAVNGHQKAGRTNQAGKYIKGGIDLPLDLAESFLAGADLAARVVSEEERLWHKTLFSVVNFDPEWATKNRFSLPPRVPSNTGELLRSVGYRLSRPVGMEKHEEYVEQLTTVVLAAFAAGAPMSKANLISVLAGPGKQLAAIVPNPLHARWIMRDAVDRAWFRIEKARSIYSEIGVSL